MGGNCQPTATVLFAGVQGGTVRAQGGVVRPRLVPATLVGAAGRKYRMHQGTIDRCRKKQHCNELVREKSKSARNWRGRLFITRV
jgi:hypothetical protein